jgi:hypothetical protein
MASPLVRRLGRDAPLAQVLAQAAGLPVAILADGAAAEDGAAIDPTLTTGDGQPETPLPGTTYAGLTPAQRRTFLEWAQRAQVPAPRAYQQIYVANLEVRLLEDAGRRKGALEELLRLAAHAPWQGSLWLGRALLLGLWLTQDSGRLADVIGVGRLPADLLGVALGQQALMAAPLTPPELGVLLAAWRQDGVRLAPDLLKLRLASWTANLGAEPLAYGLAQLPAEATQPQPWRCAHRDLRLALPKPDLRPALERPLADLLAVADVADETTPPADDAEGVEPDARWQLILEFGHSRSEFFDTVLARCQKLPGFSQLMDEDRKLVYRVTFTHSELRRFWQIWDYVQSWSSVHVYVNGVELEKWKIWPYSQYLR